MASRRAHFFDDQSGHAVRRRPRHDPAQVLGGLNRILWSEAPGQLTSAAYVWINTENRNALYSAAGHPPLLCWRNTRGEMDGA
jgi:sigma-B regulation protein RsbU (phosphoserine phosphatase)